MENLVIYGGSFDPIHNGHMRLARAASLLLNADVVFVPARSPRWKTPSASTADRLAMLKKAIKADFSTDFSISLYEINSKAETNYTIDTVRYFHKKYPKKHLYLLIGADSAKSFKDWKDADEIAKLATPLYCPRPGVMLDDADLERFQMERLPYDKSGEVSSSDVRSLRSIDIPLSVRDYIESNGLYYMQDLKEMLSPHRLQHSLSVAHLAYYIASTNKIEHHREAYIAGILHDCAKNMSPKELREIMLANYPEYLNMPEWSYHQFVSQYLAKTKFGITNERILSAIGSHATGSTHMNPLAKIIYAADKIEPGRAYDSRPLIDSCLRNYYVGFVDVLRANREFLFSKGYTIDNKLTKTCFEQYLGEIYDRTSKNYK